MIARTLALMAGIYGEIGPGLILTALLPISVLALALVLREAFHRMRAEKLPTA
jgi:hypothetical protein